MSKLWQTSLHHDPDCDRRGPCGRMPVQEDPVEVAVDGRRSDPAYDERVRSQGDVVTLLVWADLETTGLQADAEIVEIAVVITDTSLEPLWEFHEVRTPSQRGMDQLMGNDVVRTMHERTGLLQRLQTMAASPETPSLVWVQEMLIAGMGIALTKAHCDTAQFMLAGSGVASFDRRLLARDFPEFEQMLHYSAVDMGIVRRAVQFLTDKRIPDVDNPHPHMAISDVWAAIKTAKAFRDFCDGVIAGESPYPLK